MIQLPNLTKEQTAELLPDNLILLGYRGSLAHNMFKPSTDPTSVDDIDVMGVYIPKAEYYIGLEKGSDNKTKFIGEWDVVSYELTKYMGLLLKCNPNVISLLWLKDEHYLLKDTFGQQLVDFRNSFLSKHAYNSFSGYANQQLQKMERLTPLIIRQIDYCEDILKKHGIDLVEPKLTQEQRNIVTVPGIENLEGVLNEYAALRKKYFGGGYLGDKRKNLVKKHNYDSKNAGHLIRLLRMSVELLETGYVRVFRDEDRQELLDIKNGKWTLEEVKKEAEKLFQKSKEAKDKSPLPDEPDYKLANELCVSLIDTKLFKPIRNKYAT